MSKNTSLVLTLVLCLLTFAATACSAGDWSVSMWLNVADGVTVGSTTFTGCHLEGTERICFPSVDFGDYGRAEDLWLELEADPAVLLHFSFMSGVSPVQSFNGHAEMVISPAISVASAIASGGVTMTEGDDTDPSATVTGGYPNDKVWRATYNDTIVYADLVSGWSLVNSTETHSEVCNDPIAVAVNKIALDYSLSLTDRDVVSGTAHFRVNPVPEPAGLAAMLIGGCGFVGMALRRKS